MEECFEERLGSRREVKKEKETASSLTPQLARRGRSSRAELADLGFGGCAPGRRVNDVRQVDWSCLVVFQGEDD